MKYDRNRALLECEIPGVPRKSGKVRDVFDLGDRQIEVIHVGGHSPGSIVLLDRRIRIAFTGDACNGNTLLGFGNALPIEEYLGNLLHFRAFKDAFDIMYGGHQIMDPCTIDEGIETCAKVLAGTDDHEEQFENKMVHAFFSPCLSLSESRASRASGSWSMSSMLEASAMRFLMFGCW